MEIEVGSLVQFYKYGRLVLLAVYLGSIWDDSVGCYRWRLLTQEGYVWEVIDDHEVYRMDLVQDICATN